MSRTKKRALAAGKTGATSALVYAAVLGVTGMFILIKYTNAMAFWLTLTAWFSYVVPYSIAKRRTVYGTLVGAIPGAMPPAIGYITIANHLDTAVVILFLAMVFWQMAHFYAIAMFRYDDYKSAGLPVFTVVRGMTAAKKQIIAYISTYLVSLSLLTILGYTGYIYLIGSMIAGFYWLASGLNNWRQSDDAWGKRMFIDSLKVNFAISILLAFGSRLP